jgi:hypothetical protein
MKHSSRIFVSALVLAMLVASAALASGSSDAVGLTMKQTQTQAQQSDEPLAPTGTAFTYQGSLTNGGAQAEGPFDFQFRLYDAPAGGTQVGSTVVANDVPVSQGLFTYKLDFGAAAFGGGARWLDIGVRPGASGDPYTILTPRQELTPAPSALSLPNLYANEAQNFVGIGRSTRISGNEVFGIRHVGAANDYGGMYVETSNAGGWPFYGYATNGSFRAWTYYNGMDGDWYLYNAGIRLRVPDEGGLRIGPSADYSLVISSTTGADAIRIYDTADDGIQVGSDPEYPNYGVYMPSPGVSAYGLWPNTADASGEWALYTVDNIEAGNVAASAMSLVARVDGPDALAAGDVVAVMGVTDAIPGSHYPLALVRKADASKSAGVIGVVEKRMVFDVAPGKEAEGEKSLQGADGPARAGDYVKLTIFGVAQVNVEPGAAIAVGDRLTASTVPGAARPLRTQIVNGMVIAEGVQALGIALALPTDGQTSIPVFVTLR